MDALDVRLTFWLFFIVIINYVRSQTVSTEARNSCMDYLGGKLSNRYSSRQIANACDRYAKWGNMIEKGPKVVMKQIQRDYWNHLHGTHKTRPGVRKEYRLMSDFERKRFHNAVNRLKESMEGDMNRYDVLVGYHQPSFAPAAHFGAAFLGWHREFIFRMEQALQQIDSEVTLPYWDSTMDEVLGEEARHSIMWTDKFMGNLDGDVTTGPFAYWDLFFPVQNRTRLFRKSVPEGGLFTDEIIDEVITAPTFREITWFVDPNFEVGHGMVHDYVGGALGDLAASPSDPLFFILHGFVDCVFQWHRDDKVSRGGVVHNAYPNDREAHGVGIANPLGDVVERVEDSLHLGDGPMNPFQGLLNIDGLSLQYSRFYKCAPRPSCSRTSPKCGSQYLFCETKKEKCAPKLTEGANCTKWTGMDPCYEGKCCRGVCSNFCNRRQKSHAHNPSWKKPSPNKYQETVYRHQAPEHNAHLRKPEPIQYSHENAVNQPSNHYQQPTYQHQPIPPPQYHPQYNPALNNYNNYPPLPPPYNHGPVQQNAPYPGYPHQTAVQPYNPWQNPYRY